MSTHKTFLKRDPDSGKVVATIRIIAHRHEVLDCFKQLEEIEDEPNTKKHFRHYPEGHSEYYPHREEK